MGEGVLQKFTDRKFVVLFCCTARHTRCYGNNSSLCEFAMSGRSSVPDCCWNGLMQVDARGFIGLDWTLGLLFY